MEMKVAVIGGGASGLVTLKYLVQAHNFFPGVRFKVDLFESRNAIGGVFEHQVYEDAELVSSKQLTQFSDFRVPLDAPDFFKPCDYVQYLRDYVEHFELGKHIQCDTLVKTVRICPDGGHLLDLEYNGSNVENKITGWKHYDAVAVCSGLHVTPFIPDIPGLTIDLWPVSENVDDATNSGEADEWCGIKVVHSSKFKSRSQFGHGKTILILGAGETAMDIAHLAVTSDTKRVIMSHRDGFIHAPKRVPQPFRAGGRAGGPDPNKPSKPLDTAIASLFDTAYVPGFVQRGPMLWSVYDLFVKNMAWAISGTRAGFDQWAGGISRDRLYMDSIMFCKSDRAMPYISEQYRSKSLFNKARTWLINMELKPTGGRKIDLAPWPCHFDEDGYVYFEKNDRPESDLIRADGRIRPDMVVYCTGYARSFPFLCGQGDVYPTLDELSHRGIYRDIDDDIAFIGFVRPSFGAIPPLAELQAQLWVYDLIRSPGHHSKFSKGFVVPARHPDAVKPYNLDYAIHCRADTHNFAQTRRAVDQEAYAYQLAVDAGSAPTWLHVLKNFGPEVFYTWAMGPNFNTKFRLMGPWTNSKVAAEAASLMRKDGELGSVVRETGGGVFFFTYTIVPLILFGPMSIFLNLLIGLWELLAGIFLLVIEG
ncbi:dimethylaniline monooxygenase [Coniella lustricola]|uniref:Dimethylaniline monooxygenase n=1 Tax=Coniella lustricola TaxID=2025994 RepID=A0A2T2ZW43_9PEZI|nr:dimethylaniline monooxygenase [Coniella lustricola]